MIVFNKIKQIMSFLDVVSIAPMLDYTDRHFRFLMRLITDKTLLYTEMYTIKEILENQDPHLFSLDPIEHPVAIQLGGSNPLLLSQCAILAANTGYDEINLNVGCPSHRVQCGGIGASLMLQPSLVAECIKAMKSSSSVPVSIKCRLGVDDHDSYAHLSQFIEKTANAGCEKFIIHARKAWLKGLSPKQNREIPPLNYDFVYKLKKDFPHLKVILNGGITGLDEAEDHLQKLDGVMIGRACYSQPFIFANVDSRFYGHHKMKTEYEILHQYKDYIKNELKRGTKLTRMTRHLLGLFHQRPGARLWRKILSCEGSRKGAGIEVVEQAFNLMSSTTS